MATMGMQGVIAAAPQLYPRSPPALAGAADGWPFLDRAGTINAALPCQTVMIFIFSQIIPESW
jgi:hypothetical protein